MTSHAPELSIGLADLRFAGSEERNVLEELEFRIQDAINGALCAARNGSTDTEYMKRAIVPLLLSLAARHYADSKNFDSTPQTRHQFFDLADECLSWTFSRDHLNPSPKH